ncbi:MAG TPA: hypothetical protein VGI10_03140 [Polyangiaceae bacterium]|jgi:hypothetical protein
MRSNTWGKPTLLCLSALAALGCGERFRPVTAHDVAAPADPRATYGVVLEVAAREKYRIVVRDDAHLVLQVRSHVDQTDDGRVSVINFGVDPNGVHLWASGYLVHPDGTIHRRLDAELERLERVLTARLGAGAAGLVAQPTPPPQAPLAAPPPAPVAALPSAWNEPASDQDTWGRGNFTCLPLTLPAQDQKELSLELSSGERADVTLSLAYSPALCHSANECKQPAGCPALGIGDAAHVSRLAARLSKKEISSQATVRFRGQPVAMLDLSHHGSVAQAMTGTKH